jgi:hypothetical protein
MWPASGGRLRRVLERTCSEDQDATMRHPGRPGILRNAKPRTKPRHFATVRAGSLVVTTKGLPLGSYIFRIPAQQQFLQVSDKMSGVSEILLCWSFPGLVPCPSPSLRRPAYRKPKFEHWFGSKYNKVHSFREYRTSALYEFLLQFPKIMLDVYRIHSRYHSCAKLFQAG